MSQLTDFRAMVDEFMEFHPRSPLDDEAQARFKGLAYYDETPALILTVEVTPLPEDEKPVEMETSTGELRLYRRWGQFTFMIDGEEAALTIYSDPEGEAFFLPFKDATNGRETYGAGRYLDNHRPGLRQIGETSFEVDFNYAYNPYCAYQPTYSCPLPPRENWLKVPIRAGEKEFQPI
jgi:uncharacterized protein (DUF1684 family)